LAKSIRGEPPEQTGSGHLILCAPRPPFACRLCAETRAGVAQVCVQPPLHINRDAHKRARGSAPLPIPARPLLPFSQPPPSRVPPQFARDWRTKKGGVHPLPFAREPSPPPPPGAPFACNRLRRNGCMTGAAHLLPLGLCPAPALHSAQGGRKGGYPPHSPFARAHLYCVPPSHSAPLCTSLLRTNQG